MAVGPELRSLRERPFELLKELERRSAERRGAQAVAADAAGEWVGVAMRAGTQQWLIAREEVREVMEHPATTRVPGAREWVKGITNVRGRLVPVVDLVAFEGGEASAKNRSSRLIIVNHPDIPAAILVDEVLGFRRFAASEFTAVSTDDSGDNFLVGHCRRGQENWPVLSLIKLVESARFSDVAA